MVGVPAHPSEDLDRGTDCPHGPERAGRRAGRCGCAGGERARCGAREQHRADEVPAAAVVLLRRRLAGLVGADRDVLRAVVRRELAAPESDHRGCERRERDDRLAGEKPEPRAARCRCGCGADHDSDRDPWALEWEARLGQRVSNVGQHGERLCQAQRASDEGSRHVGREAPLDAGGRADRAVVGADRGTPRGRAVHEDSVRERHTAEPQFVHGLRVPCWRWSQAGARPDRSRARRAGRRRRHPRRDRRPRCGGKDDARPDDPRCADRLDRRVLGRPGVRDRADRA